MSVISEGKLRFEFPAEWQAIKYDETNWHRQRFGHHQALDILASQEERLWLIEIKDCVGFEDDNRPRLSTGDPESVKTTRNWLKEQNFGNEVMVCRSKPFIIDEVIEKVRATLLALMIARREKEPDLIHYAELAAEKPITVVLLLSWTDREFPRLARLLQTKLDNQLKNYGFGGLIVNEAKLEQILLCRITRLEQKS